MILLDSVLLTLDIKVDTLINAFNAKSFQYLKSVIKRGSGPKEETLIYPDLRTMGSNRFLYRNKNTVKLASYDEGQIEVKE